MRPDRLRLLDALEQIELIRKFAEPGRGAFFSDPLDGELVAFDGGQPSFALLTRRFPGTKIVAFRNVAIHQYFGIDRELVWAIITGHLAALSTSREARLNALEA